MSDHSALPLTDPRDTATDPEAVVWEFLATSDLPAVAAYLRKIGADYHEAEECAQLALTACWEKRATIQHMQAYLRGAARKIYLRRTPKTQQVELHEADQLAASHDASPDVRAEMREQIDTVLAAMEQLPYGQRDALSLLADGRTVTEIAQLTGTTAGAVRTRISRARTQLKILLAPTRKETSL
ncbi:RNA polymerase sigma factor [Nocardiopsis sediminis]|uniref:RNA polymerase sigma factor n=1 Tax=Nocardiopsis sediminis TaxID=1778267 RepID=A0ABV8FWI6_9ACTN